MKTNELNQLPEGIMIGNRYEINEVIGQGGFGITYRGFDHTLNVPVAIKEYYPSGIASRYSTQSFDVQVGGTENKEAFEKGKAKFLEEARMLAKHLDDPNVVSVRDFFEDNETAYIVMEFLEGESVKSLIDRNGKMTFNEALELVRPVMHSLDSIHKSGLIHRDISPSNLICLDDGKIKLIDFGTTREINMDSEKSMSIMFKPGYAPPEQYRSKGSQGPWTDVYAMCASIYKMITGVTPENSLARVLVDELPAPSKCGAEVSPAQEEALMRGLSVDFRDRFQSMKELEEALDAAALEQPAAGQPDADDECTVEGPLAAEVEDTVPDKPNKVKKQRDRKSGKVKKQLRSAKKKKKILIAAIAGGLILAAVVVLAILYSKGSLAPSSIAGGRVISYGNGDQTVHFGSSGEKTVITTGMLDKVDASPKVNELEFFNCELSDEAITRIGSMKRIKTIEIISSAGFTTLDPLSGVTTLERLIINAGSGQMGDINVNDMFRSEFPQVTYLNIENYKLNGGLDFLGHFSGVKELRLIELEIEGSTALPDMQSLEQAYFDGTDLSRTDLSALGKDKNLITASLNSCDLSSLEFLKGAESVQYIYANDNQLTSLDGLQEMALLRELHADRNQISDISALAGKLELYMLDLNDNQISDVTVLNECTGLLYLYLKNNQINDVRALSGCSKLAELDLAGNRLDDLSAIGSCGQLKTLNFKRNNISDLSFCEKMLVLRKLYASENEISDLSGLSNVTQLEIIYLDHNQISDITVLAKSGSHLKAVVLDDNEVADLSPLKNCTGLTVLSVNNNELTALSGLEGCTELNFLSASNNRISDISALGSCTNLYGADLGENEIDDITALEGSMSAKMALLLQNNKIKDISPLYGEKDYKYLVLYNNEITDISPLSVINGISSSSIVYLDWFDGFDALTLAGCGYSKPKLTDVPLDLQVNMQKEFQDARKADNKYNSEIIFVTEEEAESEIADVRSDIRDTAGIKQ